MEKHKHYISTRCPICGAYMKKSKHNPKIYVCSARCGYYYNIEKQ